MKEGFGNGVRFPASSIVVAHVNTVCFSIEKNYCISGLINYRGSSYYRVGVFLGLGFFGVIDVHRNTGERGSEQNRMAVDVRGESEFSSF